MGTHMFLWRNKKKYQYFWIEKSILPRAKLFNALFLRCPEHVHSTLRATAQHNIQRDGILATRLCTHKEDVDQINDYHLKKLQGKVQ